MLLTPEDPRLGWWSPLPAAVSTDPVRLERFPRDCQQLLQGQIGPLANLRSSSGCAVVLTTDSPWVELRLDRLRHHQPVPQGVALEVDLFGDNPGIAAESADLRESSGTVAVRLATGLERGSPPRACWLWLPPISTVAVAGVVVADRSAVSLTAMPPPRWLAIGDSLTQGFSVQSPRAAWVHRLASRWRLPAWNLGIGGALIEPQVFSWALSAFPWDLVAIALGSNHGWKDSTMDQVAERAAVLAEAACACPARRVAWILPPWKACEDGLGPPDFAGVPLDRGTGERMARVRAMLRACLARFAPRLQLIDEVVPHDARLLPDGLHPAAHGSALIADRIAATLAP